MWSKPTHGAYTVQHVCGVLGRQIRHMAAHVFIHMAKLTTTMSSSLTPRRGNAGRKLSSIWSAVFARSRHTRESCSARAAVSGQRLTLWTQLLSELAKL